MNNVLTIEIIIMSNSFSYTVLFELMETVKLLLFLAIYADFSESSQGRNWNFQ